MRIRKLKKEDAKKVSNIIRKCLVEIVSKDYSKKAIANLYDFFTPALIIQNSKDRDVFVAVEYNKVLGTASLKDDMIHTVFVNPNSHGEGVGSKLMDKVEAVAKKNGYKVVRIPSGKPSFEFYERRGYTKVKIVRSKTHGDTIEMKKIL